MQMSFKNKNMRVRKMSKDRKKTRKRICLKVTVKDGLWRERV